MEKIQIPFTDYCLTADHATALIRHQTRPETIFSNLITDNRADDFDGFIQSNKAMPTEAMDYFLLRFCLAFPQKAEDYLNWRLLDGGPGKDFGMQLLKEYEHNIQGFFKFLEQHDFFIYLGAENQQKLFDPALRECIKKLYQTGQEPLDVIRSVRDKPKIALQLMDYLAEITLEEAKEYFDLIMLLEAYPTFYQDTFFTGTQLKLIAALIHLLLKSVENATPEDLSALQEHLETLEKKLTTEQAKKLAGPEILYAPVLAKIKFILQVLAAGKDFTHLANRVNLTNEDYNFFIDGYIRFVISVAGTGIWSDKLVSDGYAKALVKIFAFNKEGEENRFLLADGGKGSLLDFIPQYSAHLILKKTRTKLEYEEKLAEFYLNYTYALWQNYENKTSEDPINKYFKKDMLLKKIVNYLNFLNENNSSVCYAVVQAIVKDDAPDTVELRQHIEANIRVNTIGGMLNNMLKKIPFPFKKNDHP